MTEIIQSAKLKGQRKLASPFKQVNFGSIEEDDKYVLSTQTFYNASGQTEKEVRYNKQGAEEEVHIYSYDNNNKLVLHSWSMPLEGVEESEKTERDEKGRVIREVRMYSGDEGESVSYTYDEKGNVIVSEHFDEEGNSTLKETLEYDEDNKMKSRIVDDAANNKYSRYNFLFNEMGRIMEQAEHDKKGQLVSTTKFEQDEMGNDISIVQVNAKNEVTQRVKSAYDDKARLLSRVSSGFYTRIATHEYDENGNLADETTTDENGTIISRSTYDYDDHNRLVYETSYEMDLTHSGRDNTMAYKYEYDYW